MQNKQQTAFIIYAAFALVLMSLVLLQAMTPSAVSDCMKTTGWNEARCIVELN